METPVAISEKLRRSIFRKLSPIIGEEETAAVLAHFPAREVEEPATRELVQLEAALLRTEIAEARRETATSVAEIKVDLHQTITRLFIASTTLNLTIAGVALAIAKA